MSSTPLEHMYLLPRSTAHQAATRTVLVLGNGHDSLHKIARRVGDMCGHGQQADVRSVVCHREDTGIEHAVLRRLLDTPGGEPLPPHKARHAALEHITGLLTRSPVLLAIGDAQWCDQGTLRCIDHLSRGTAGLPLTIVLNVAPGALTTATAPFLELMTRKDWTVVDATALAPDGTGPADGAVPGAPHPHEPDPLRVARASALLNSTDEELVAALTGLPTGVTRRALHESRDLGLLPEDGAPPSPGSLLDALPAAERERMRTQAAEILNDAARPARQVADLLLGLSALDRPWMAAVLKEAATEARPDHPASSVSYLNRLHEADPDDATTRTELATALLDIDPAAARAHFDGLLSRTDDPDVRARITVPLWLSALMTHRTPETPAALGGVLRALRDGAPDQAPPHRARPEPAGTSPLSGDGPRECLVRAVDALRTALAGTDPDAATADAHHVLRAEPPHTAWERVSAAKVLGLADETETALPHLDRIVADSERRQETWAEYHARSTQALLLLETGRVCEAYRTALAATRLAERHGWGQRTRLAPVTLTLALLARGEPGRAEGVLRRLGARKLDDTIWDHHLYLMARALVARAHGRVEQALDLLERCGASLDSAGVRNPVFTKWWLYSTGLLMELGRPRAARERAELGRHLAEQWPRADSSGLSLLALGMTAGPADRVELLAESVRVLAGTAHRYSYAVAELRLGQELLQRRDDAAARSRLQAARATAVRSGMAAVAEKARSALAAAGGRRPALSGAEQAVARLAADGATNRAIADTLYLSVRTVEYHLTSVYRKLGIDGRAGLAEWPSLPEPGAAARALSDRR
ncbi:LuxR C-terminal-related transcriptional regulator [Streptomyces albus]|uniref:LuxR family transcriptional regulator n=1 Tax=Streptomyces albus TaxID=1888 RepID=UPI0024AE4D51|nr:LuxR family transcriptional regulator [Streptomyces albus]MDI6410467.1 LuxR C-terminal-related transcriptional regulator [Streptomyces albus]